MFVLLLVALASYLGINDSSPRATAAREPCELREGVERILASQGEPHASARRPRFDNPILGPRFRIRDKHVKHAVGDLFAELPREIVKVDAQHTMAIAVEQGHCDQVLGAQF
jgi:hypothetical protein